MRNEKRNRNVVTGRDYFTPGQGRGGKGRDVFGVVTVRSIKTVGETLRSKVGRLWNILVTEEMNGGEG